MFLRLWGQMPRPPPPPPPPPEKPPPLEPPLDEENDEPDPEPDDEVRVTGLEATLELNAASGMARLNDDVAAVPPTQSGDDSR